jgi:hypothetical protein
MVARVKLFACRFAEDGGNEDDGWPDGSPRDSVIIMKEPTTRR